MDWIDEQIERVRKRMMSVNLKQSLGIYLFIAILGVLMAVILTLQVCSGWIDLLETPYREETVKIAQTLEGAQRYIFYGSQLVKREEIPIEIRMLLTVLYGFRQFSVIPYTIIAVILVAKFYYKNKLRIPFELLLKEAEYIGNNQLDYSCRYESGDEIGVVCNAVDRMRIQLGQNQGKIWEEMEEQRRLNAAFAHDMRTPLTVLHGYVDLLLDYHFQENITPEKMQEILELMDGQLCRLEEFANTMKKIHGLSERKAGKKEVLLSEIRSRMEETVTILNHSQEITMEFQAGEWQDQTVRADLPLILEVIDNLIANALNYTESRIWIQMAYDAASGILRLYVRDDGRGFTDEKLKMAVRPYYGENKGSGLHFGIGLSICKLLCEKHGGSISLSNSLYGGAIVCGEFQV